MNYLDTHYQAPSANLWIGRKDSLPNERVFQFVQLIDVTKQKIEKGHSKQAIVGFCCDAGVKRNLGRPGAADGPNALRQALSGMPAHQPAFDMIDVGNIVCLDDDLETAQAALAELVAELLAKGYRPTVLGGGHETAWGHYQGIVKAYPDSQIGIINFDAHFDMRPLLQGNKGSSGTPFLQIAEACKAKHATFNYLCLGIQHSGNTASLFKTAEQWDVATVLAEDIHIQGPLAYRTQIEQFIAKQDKIYLSICLDVLAAAFAPGVSAPQAFGLTPWELQAMIKWIMQSGKVISRDFVELAPNFDQHQLTAKLAAQLMLD